MTLRVVSGAIPDADRGLLGFAAIAVNLDLPPAGPALVLIALLPLARSDRKGSLTRT
jgi:hypothetical protein